MFTRLEIARELGQPESKLRAWEQSGVLPVFGSVPLLTYTSRLRLVLAAREGGLSLQRVRRALEMVESGTGAGVLFTEDK